MSKKFYFKLDDKEDEKLRMDSIYLFDEHCISEIFPKEISALLEFKHHLQMLSDDDLEMSFGNLKRQAEELDERFRKLKKLLRAEVILERKKTII